MVIFHLSAQYVGLHLLLYVTVLAHLQCITLVTEVHTCWVS